MLTAKQEEFCKGIIEGKSQADAYRSAYSCKRMSDKTIWENASRLMANSNVIARVQELRDQIAKSSIMTAQERLEYLTRVIKGEEKEKILQYDNGEAVEVEITPSLRTRLNAVDIMNKMQGEYTQKVVADVSSEVTINIELTDE